MHLYQVLTHAKGRDIVTWHITKDEAHKEAKRRSNQDKYADPQVLLFNFNSVKNDILALLNGKTSGYLTMRWKLNDKGNLIEWKDAFGKRSSKTTSNVVTQSRGPVYWPFFDKWTM